MKRGNVKNNNVQNNGIKLSPISFNGDGGPSVPSQVVGVNASPGDTLIVVSWSAVVHDPVVTSYVVRHRVSPAGPWIPNDNGQDVGNVTNFNLMGLVNGTAYDIAVAAVNIIGTGAFSVTVTGTPETLPDFDSNDFDSNDFDT